MTLLHHVALGARDVEQVAGFYRDLLGLPELERRYDSAGALRAIWLDMAGTLLMIEQTAEPPRHVAAVGAGPFLLAFAVSQSGRVELEAALETAGFAIEARTEHSSYARDPEGNRVAISHYPHPSRSA